MRIQRLAALRAINARRRQALIHSASQETVAASAGTADELLGIAPGVVESARRDIDASSIKSTARILLIALALGWAADFLFYGRSLGVSVPIYVAILLASLYIVARFQGVSPMRRNLWLFAPILFFAVMVYVRANELLTFLNVTTIVVLLCLLAYFYAAGHIERLGLLGYPATIISVAARALVKAGPSVGTIGAAATHRRPNVGVAAPVLRGIVVALPVLILFAALLASADSIFRQLLTDTFNLRVFDDLPEMLGHLIVILTVGWLVAGGLLIAISRGQARQYNAAEADATPGVVGQRSLFGFIEGATILGLVNVLFAVFAWIQFSNIFFGAPTGMPFEEYRDYVRGGFGQLLLVCVLTIGLILGVRLFARTDSPRQVVSLQILSTIMVGLTFVMLVSAYMRMDAWVSVQFYINTQIRIYVRAFIIWLGVVFAWLLFTMWFRRDRFAIGAFVVALGFLVTINLANPDADVAASNLARKDELSVRYLGLLSDDAVPQLVAGYKETTDFAIRSTLRTHLSYRLSDLEYAREREGWQSFHLARSEAYNLLIDLEKSGQLEPTP